MHGGTNPGAPRGNQNAIKHGAYSAEVVEIKKETARVQRIWREFRKGLPSV